MSKSQLEERLLSQMQEAGLPAFEREVMFHPSRRWRLDFANRHYMIAIEIDGGAWAMRCKKCHGSGCSTCRGTGQQMGRHSFGDGFNDDRVKWNEIALHGWLLLHVTADLIQKREALIFVERALRGRGWSGDRDERRQLSFEDARTMIMQDARMARRVRTR